MLYKQLKVNAGALRAAMVWRRVNAVEVARRSGVSARHIQGLAHGSRPGISVETATKIAAVLDVEITDFATVIAASGVPE